MSAYELGRLGLERHMVQSVLRLIHLRVRWQGVSAQEIHEWGQHPFPELRTAEPIEAIGRVLDRELNYHGRRATAQIVWHLPDEVPDDYELTPHVDVPDAGQRFNGIVGVALTAWSYENGGLCVWPRAGDRGYHTITLAPGHVVMLDPSALHSPGINRTGSIRIGLYFRWMEPI